MVNANKNRAMLFVAVGCSLAAVMVLCAIPLLKVSGDKSARLLEGTSVTEKTLNRQEQIKLLSDFSPVVVPPTALAIKITYQRFQDSRFDGSFGLPPSDYRAFVGKLTPSTAKGQNEFMGKQIGAYKGRVWTEPKTCRVHVEYVSF